MPAPQQPPTRGRHQGISPGVRERSGKDRLGVLGVFSCFGPSLPGWRAGPCLQGWWPPAPQTLLPGCCPLNSAACLWLGAQAGGTMWGEAWAGDGLPCGACLCCTDLPCDPCMLPPPRALPPTCTRPGRPCGGLEARHLFRPFTNLQGLFVRSTPCCCVPITSCRCNHSWEQASFHPGAPACRAYRALDFVLGLGPPFPRTGHLGVCPPGTQAHSDCGDVLLSLHSLWTFWCQFL